MAAARLAWLRIHQRDGGTHEVVQTGKARFEIKPKAAAEVGADIAAQAGMTAKAPSAKPRGDYSFLDKPQDPVAEAAAQAATSPENDRPEPTDAQKEAGKASRAPSGSVSRAPAPKADQATAERHAAIDAEFEANRKAIGNLGLRKGDTVSFPAAGRTSSSGAR